MYNHVMNTKVQQFNEHWTENTSLHTGLEKNYSVTNGSSFTLGGAGRINRGAVCFKNWGSVSFKARNFSRREVASLPFQARDLADQRTWHWKVPLENSLGNTCLWKPSRAQSQGKRKWIQEGSPKQLRLSHSQNGRAQWSVVYIPPILLIFFYIHPEIF